KRAADRPPRAPGRSLRPPPLPPETAAPRGWARAGSPPRTGPGARRGKRRGSSSLLEAHQDRSVRKRLGIVAPEQAFVHEGEGPVRARRAARPGALVPDA